MVKIKYMSVTGIHHVFFLLGTVTRIYIATVNLLNASCSEIPFIFHIYPLLSVRQAKHFYSCLPSKTRNCFDKSFVKQGKQIENAFLCKRQKINYRFVSSNKIKYFHELCSSFKIILETGFILSRNSLFTYCHVLFE